MANTYTQIYLHVVFAVEGRQSLIMPEHNDELQKYITGNLMVVLISCGAIPISLVYYQCH